MSGNGSLLRYWGPWRSGLSRVCSLLVLACLMTTWIPTASGQSSGQNSMIKLSAELLSIEQELYELSDELMRRNAELGDWKRRSEKLSKRLREAETRLEQSQRESAALSNLVTKLRGELKELQTAYERSEESWRERHETVVNQLDQVREERDREAAQRQRLRRIMWIGGSVLSAGSLALGFVVGARFSRILSW